MSDGAALAFKVVIPARLGSTRLPRKVLRDIGGKPVIQHVWQAAQSTGASEVVIATDSDEVRAICASFGADVQMTSAQHQSGTDRVMEVAGARGWDAATIVVNLQGDEPLMPPALVRQAAQLLSDDALADLASLCHAITDVDEWCNPNVVKLVMDNRNYAMYFSRAPIPWKRDGSTSVAPMLPAGLVFRHIGLYAYRVAALARFSALPSSALEDCEALEQLRALSEGLRIKMGITDKAPPRGIDTEDDLQAVIAFLGR